ncbi:MAG: glycosyltransferase [Ginsengibacter sp.]
MNKEALPMISCIMPTYNRRSFVPNAIRYFLRQDYENKELIIIDDGEDVVKDLVPQSNNIRYFRLDHKISLGAKLNLACEYAKGNIIANWDDDDWYSSTRLSYQANALKNEKIFICGINNLLYYDLLHQGAFNYIYPSNQRPWLIGSSLCFRKQFWQLHHFEEIDVGMDGLFVWKAASQNIDILHDSTFSVHMIHGNNVSPKSTNNMWWHPYPVEEIKQIMGDDWPQYYQNNLMTEAINPISEPLIKNSETHGQAALIKNIYACLVHENKDCIMDLVHNLHYLDPTSVILLYNGGTDKELLAGCSDLEKYGVIIYPKPVSQKWGYLYSFAVECMEFALLNLEFDTITFVDSDQLCLRPGYVQCIGEYLNSQKNVGMLSSMPDKVENDILLAHPTTLAFKEYDLWKPFLKNFDEGESKFVHWTFWPSTVFTHDAARDLVQLIKTNNQLKEILQHTKIWASEEIILPTLISLLGYEIALNPCSYDFVKYKKEFSIGEASEALNQTDAYWIHPVKREYNHHLRNYIRQHFNQYNNGLSNNCFIEKSTPKVCTASIISTIKKIQGWLSDNEATLLIAVMQNACANLTSPHSIVEIGSYHGKSTVLFGTIIKAISPGGRIYAIDTHDGKLGAIDKGLQSFPPSFESFKKNLDKENLTDVVEIIKDHSKNVDLKIPISVLFIDGFHDYTSVANDFEHFSSNIRKGGYVAFHDYADYFPGVKLFVDELLDRGTFRKFNKADSLMVLEKV